MEERIVCAAHKLNNDIVLCMRHCDDFAIQGAKHVKDSNAVYFLMESEQGFYTNKRRFVNRTEAYVIAANSAQIVRRVGGDNIDGGTLYSENLY